MELQINGHDYRTGKLDAFGQFHVARRLAPAWFAMGAGARAAIQNGALAEGITLSALAPLIGVIAGMSDADSQFVLDSCLGACMRLQGTSYAKVFVAGGGIAFADIDMPVMMQLVLAVIQDNHLNFLDALPTPPSETAPPAA